MKQLSTSLCESHLKDSDTSICSRKSQQALADELQKERAMVEELEKLLIESDEEIKRLNLALVKAEQKDQKKTMMFEFRITELESQNAQYKKRIELYERNKRKKSQQLSTSQKMPKFSTNMSLNMSASNNTQNHNTLNTTIQQCHNPMCLKTNEKMKQMCLNTIKNLDKIHYSLKVRSFNKFNEKKYDKYCEQMKSQMKARIIEEEKDSLYLLKKLQYKLNNFQQALDNNTKAKNSDPVFKVLKSIEEKQNTLIRIPFLEKLDFQNRRVEAESLLMECKKSRVNILNSLGTNNE